MDDCFDPDIPTTVVTRYSIRFSIFLLVFWFIGFVLPFMIRPVSYAEMKRIERKTYPEYKKFKLERHIFSKEIFNYLEEYSKFFSHKLKMSNLSLLTYEGNPIPVIHIKLPKFYNNKIRGKIFVLAGMSGCIWDSILSSIDIIHKLCEECSYKYPFTWEYEWYIIPIFNPDGYDYTLKIRDYDNLAVNYIKEPRNRRRFPNEKCGGVYLDRNFGFHWGESKEVDYKNHCWYGFAGLFPFSENETQAMNRFVTSEYKKGMPFTMYLQLHGSEIGIDEITYPWRYTLRRAANYKVLNKMAKNAAEYVNNKTGYRFSYSQSSYRDRSSGVMIDWLKGTRQVEYAFCIEPWYSVSNSSKIPDPKMYIEKVTNVAFSLAKSLHNIQTAHRAPSI